MAVTCACESFAWRSLIYLERKDGVRTREKDRDVQGFSTSSHSRCGTYMQINQVVKVPTQIAEVLPRVACHRRYLSSNMTETCGTRVDIFDSILLFCLGQSQYESGGRQ